MLVQRSVVSGWSENRLPVQMGRYVKHLWMAILAETCPLHVTFLLRGILSVPVRGRLLVIKVFFSTGVEKSLASAGVWNFERRLVRNCVSHPIRGKTESGRSELTLKLCTKVM